MARYRLLEVYDRVLDTVYWVIQKQVFWVFWTRHFEEHSEDGATFYDQDKALIWYEHHTKTKDRLEIRIIKQNK